MELGSRLPVFFTPVYFAMIHAQELRHIFVTETHTHEFRWEIGELASLEPGALMPSTAPQSV